MESFEMHVFLIQSYKQRIINSGEEQAEGADALSGPQCSFDLGKLPLTSGVPSLVRT